MRNFTIVKGESIYLNADDLNLLWDILANDVDYSPNDPRVEEKEKVADKILRIGYRKDNK